MQIGAFEGAVLRHIGDDVAGAAVAFEALKQEGKILAWGLSNFDVADVPKGRELLYPGVANVIGNALRELNLEDVEPAMASPPAKPTVVEFRTFDGLVVRTPEKQA